MTAQTTTVLKTYFETGDKPNQSQFSDLIDSYLNLSNTALQVVHSQVTVSGAVNFKSSFGIAGTTTVSGATSIANTLTVTGSAATSLTGNVTVGGALAVSAASTLGAATLSGNLTVSTSANTSLTGNLSVTGPSTLTAGIVGTATNDSAATGRVGEYVTAVVLLAGKISLTNVTTANITTISLTAGDWDVGGSLSFLPTAGTTLNFTAGGATQSNATLGVQPDIAVVNAYGTTGAANAIAISYNVPEQRMSLSGTTTIYLVAQGSFSGSTLDGFGRIWARRRR